MQGGIKSAGERGEGDKNGGGKIGGKEREREHTFPTNSLGSPPVGPLSLAL